MYLCMYVYIYINGCMGLFMLGFCQTDFGYQNYI